MHILAEWLKEPRIFRFGYSDVVTIDDMDMTLPSTLEKLDGGTPKVHVICDLTAVTKLDFALEKLLNRPQSDRFYDHPHLGWLIYVGDMKNPFYQFVTATLAQNKALRMRWFFTIEEAIHYLEDIDETLA